MNRLCCFLTGGHRYSDLNLQVYDSLSHKVVFINTCDKCGKKYEVELDEDHIYSNIRYMKGHKKWKK